MMSLKETSFRKESNNFRRVFLFFLRLLAYAISSVASKSKEEPLEESLSKELLDDKE